jgi:hypothetical protein
MEALLWVNQPLRSLGQFPGWQFPSTQFSKNRDPQIWRFVARIYKMPLL